MRLMNSLVPKCAGYFDFAQYRLWGSRRWIAISGKTRYDYRCNILS
jgi:hypothetical protein